jgi:hypothetical protein
MAVDMSTAERVSSMPACLDMEASGFGRDSYPIEVGYVLPNGRSFCTLIRPHPGWTHWDPVAERLHQLPRQTVMQHGRDVVEVASRLNAELSGMTLYCDGWAHDYAWLHLLFDAAGRTPRFRLDNVRRLLSDAEAERWHETKEQVAGDVRVARHRASGDARLLQLTWARVRTQPAAA